MEDSVMRQLTQSMLAEKFVESKFRHLIVKAKDGGLDVSVSGQTFGFIPAVAACIVSLSKSSEIPVNVLMKYIELTLDMIDDCDVERHPVSDSMMELFMNEINREGDR